MAHSLLTISKTATTMDMSH